MQQSISYRSLTADVDADGMPRSFTALSQTAVDMDGSVRIRPSTCLGMEAYHWLVFFAVWFGRVGDAFDVTLFSLVSPNVIPALLGLEHGTSDAQSATTFWAGILTSLVLIAWAIGGVLFGLVIDKIGRTRSLVLVVLLFSVGTAASAAAPNLSIFFLCRIIAAMGSGGDFAAGAALVAEVVTEERRVVLGAILFTGAYFGVGFASLANRELANSWFKGDPATSWRYVLLFGLAPSVVVLVLRCFIREPERWVYSTAIANSSVSASAANGNGVVNATHAANTDAVVGAFAQSDSHAQTYQSPGSDGNSLSQTAPMLDSQSGWSSEQHSVSIAANGQAADAAVPEAEPAAVSDQSPPVAANVGWRNFLELFSPKYRRATLSGLGLTFVSLITLWTVQAFLPVIANGLAEQEAKARGYNDEQKSTLSEDWKTIATVALNGGGLLGSIFNAWVANRVSRRSMFAIYLSGTVVAVALTYGLHMAPLLWLWLQATVGFFALGVFSSSGYYLVELFETRLRGTGAGVCYNLGRLVAAAGPFAVAVVSQGSNALNRSMWAVFGVGFFPFLGVLGLPWVMETQGSRLRD